ncbi:MAG: MFS transporter [Flavobacteriaceae bacterium]|nr:MAG: MFS transporter [Flavobacteriaceae bacterium]
MRRSRHILPIIIVSQFCCTSLWFAGNAVLNDLVIHLGLDPASLGHLTSAVQFGFIIGTLVFAVLTIADRFSPSKVFFISAVLGGIFNVGLIWGINSLSGILVLRFFTGFFLAGIYPIGMKIAADYYEKGLGKSLGFLVGALVLGTAIPHLLRDLSEGYSWKSVMIATTSISFFGGLLMVLFVPDGPFRKRSQQFDFSAFFEVFKNGQFRSAAFGYFGHMWELYAFYVFVPVMLKGFSAIHPEVLFNVPLISFFVISSGSLSCVIGGYLSQIYGAKKVGFLALLLSCACCLISPAIFAFGSEHMFIGFLIFWGMVVIMDSPMFSTLVAQNTTAEKKGTALTIVNCIGFAITILSIQLMNEMNQITDSSNIYVFLAIGPVLGLISLRTNYQTSDEDIVT